MKVTHCLGSAAIAASRWSKSALIWARNSSRSALDWVSARDWVAVVRVDVSGLAVVRVGLVLLATRGPPIPADVAADGLGPRPQPARRHTVGAADRWVRGVARPNCCSALLVGAVWCGLVRGWWCGGQHPHDGAGFDGLV